MKAGWQGKFYIRRRHLIGFAGFLVIAGIIALAISLLVPGNESNAARQASATTGTTSETPDPSAISAIPNSLAIAKPPSKATGSPGASERANQKAIARGTTSAKSGGTSGTYATDSTKGGGNGAASGSITAGNSRANCITLNFPGGVLDQSVIDAATSLTGIIYNCIDTFANPVQSWEQWETPWMLSTAADGWDAWLAKSPVHQVIVGMDLIPQSVANTSNPLAWEQPCASGSYNQYATTLAKNLVSYGAGGIVIRLGVEANGDWEDDYVGTTVTEMNAWAKCFDNEVTAMRAVPEANFLFVWNPNICTANLALNEWYPGSAYVDIIGVDAYDKDCLTLNTVSQEGWATYSNNSSGNTPNNPNFPSLANIRSFAAAHGKAFALPEWAIYSGSLDDATYVNQIAQLYNGGNFSFESYYDTGGSGIAMLGSAIPSATAAYAQAFK